MDFVTSLFSSINFQLIFQLTCLALIVISGPFSIFFLSATCGDL
ncbi:MAG: photosystem II reaction center protein Ycf12/Psb30 [Pseudanabaena sp.]